MSNNKRIISNENIQGWLKLTVQENSGELKTITIPAQVNGKDILLLDPYDKTIVNSDIFLARISPQAKLIYLVICSYGDGCFLSRNNLVTASGYQKNTVMACTKELSENNMISIVKASGKLNQYFTNNPKKWTCDKTSVLQEVI